MKILLGVDFSRDSKKAIRFLSEIQFPARSELFLFHVISNHEELKVFSLSRAILGDLGKLREKTLARVHRNLEKIGEQFVDRRLKTQIVVKEGNPGKEILSFLEKKGIDLVVLGTRGISGLKRYLLGSVSEWILQEAPCPVLVVRGSARRTYGGMRVLMATDGSADAQAALKFLNKLSFPPHSQVVLFHVVEQTDYTVVQDDYGVLSLGTSGTPNLTPISKKIRGRLDQARMTLLKEAKKGITHKNVKIEKVSIGFAEEEIIKAAERFRADLIVLGSRGLTGLKRTFLGSVSSRTARHAPCPVSGGTKNQKTNAHSSVDRTCRLSQQQSWDSSETMMTAVNPELRSVFDRNSQNGTLYPTQYLFSSTAP